MKKTVESSLLLSVMPQWILSLSFPRLTIGLFPSLLMVVPVVYYLVFLVSFFSPVHQQFLPGLSSQIVSCSRSTPSDDSCCNLGCHWAISYVCALFPHLHTKPWQGLWQSSLPFPSWVAVYNTDYISWQYIVSTFLNIEMYFYI